MTVSSDPTEALTQTRESMGHAAPRFVLPLAPSLVRRRLQVYVALIVGDSLAIVTAFWAISIGFPRDTDISALLDLLAVFIPLYWMSALFMRVYSLKPLISLRVAQLWVIYALLIAVTALVFICYLAHSPVRIGRLSLILDLFAAAVLLVSLRNVMHPLVLHHCGPTAENVLIINDNAETTGKDILPIPGAWTVYAQESFLRPDFCDPHMLDRLGLYMTNMDRVLVTCPPERRAAWAMVLKGSNISGEIVDQDVVTLGVMGARRERTVGTLVVSVGPLSLQSRAIKRAMDLSIAGGAILFLSPLLLIVAALIWLEDHGPVFFRQQRQGRNNRLFWIYKFRSMRVQQHDLAGTRSASPDDDRMTKVGRFIRRISFDEVPQVINVLRGEMSIVGPRPHAIGSLAGTKQFWEVDARYLIRHSLKPGLTGLAQVRGLRGATDTETDISARLQADLEYLDNWTLLRDIRIILATIRVLVHKRAF